MLNRVTSGLLGRLLAALLLLTVGLHAAAPVGSPLHRGQGSAFSASTADLALSPVRQEQTLRTALPFGADWPPLQRLPAMVFAACAQADAPLLRPDSTGPPARAILARQPSPRAPPFA